MSNEELNNLFADIRQTCGDCEHPRCLSITKSAKEALYQLMLEVTGEDEQKLVTHESYLTSWGSSKVRTVHRWGPGARQRNALRAEQRSRLNAVFGK